MAADAFLTGYAVTPGEASIVHHPHGLRGRPASAGDDGRTNAAIMQALDDESPDRLGWPCFGGAGDKIDGVGVPVTWAPGQGVVNYPTGMGVPMKTTDKLVVQIHYNLADPASAGKIDTTTVHLRFADSVDRPIAFLLPDPFLDSAGEGDAGHAGSRAGRHQVHLDEERRPPRPRAGLPSVDLLAVMPHMHGRGIRQRMSIGPAGNLACASHLENWGFHWQEFYFYKTPHDDARRRAGAGHLRVRHLKGHRPGVARLGHPQRDVPGGLDGGAAAVLIGRPR